MVQIETIDKGKGQGGGTQEKNGWMKDRKREEGWRRMFQRGRGKKIKNLMKTFKYKNQRENFKNPIISLKTYLG